MHKTRRLITIEKLIEEEEIPSQSILLKKLRSKGMACTQATLSRNLKQLGASRLPDGKGGYRYFLSRASGSPVNESVNMNIVPVIRDIIEAKGLLVIRTIPGNANATAYYIDNAGRYEIAGTIAGDDTILLIPRNGITTGQVHTCLEIILPGLHRQIAQIKGSGPESKPGGKR